MDQNTNTYEQEQILLWKLKRKIKFLENAKGDGTSMISLIISPGDQISTIMSMLTNESGTASSIKSRVNRQSVQSAIVSTQQRLKRYSKIPNTGLCIYSGLIDDKMEVVDIVPTKCLGTSLYLCDSKFNTGPLKVLLCNSDIWGFIIIDGQGMLLGSLNDNNKETLYKCTVDLPKKHNKGGQSSARFGRLRLEKRHNYITKMSEIISKHFISDNKINVKGIILAGNAEFKDELYKYEKLDPKIKENIIDRIDTSYGFENGFSQAIELSKHLFLETKFMKEKNIINKFLENITMDTNKLCFGVQETIECISMGQVETLILYEDIDILRVVTNEGIRYVKNGEKCSEEILSEQNWIEWLTDDINNRKSFNLEIISNKTQEGVQFIAGFGGCGSILRWPKDDIILEDSEYFEEFSNDY